MSWNFASRTSLFRVTDEEAYKDLYGRLKVDTGELVDLTEAGKDGILRHGFAALSGVDYDDGCADDKEFIAFMYALSEILPEGEACIYMQVCNNDTKFVDACWFIATKNGVSDHFMQGLVSEKVKEMLRNEDFKTALYEGEY